MISVSLTPRRTRPWAHLTVTDLPVTRQPLGRFPLADTRTRAGQEVGSSRVMVEPHIPRRMDGGDRRLQLVRTRRPVPQRTVEQPNAFLDLAAVPARPVLVFEQHDLAGRGVVRGTARVMQQHQRDQTACLGLVGHEAGDQLAEPDRLLAQAAMFGCVASGGVALAALASRCP